MVSRPRRSLHRVRYYVLTGNNIYRCWDEVYARVQKICFWVGIAGLAIVFAFLLFGNNETFRAGLEQQAAIFGRSQAFMRPPSRPARRQAPLRRCQVAPRWQFF